MALIKCRECGYDVSDKAYKCPNCGCLLEVEVTPEEIEVEVTPGITKEYEEEPQNRRTGLWILVAVLICAVLGGGYFVFDHFVNADDKDAIVELTPEFIKAVNQYDELGVFSEGRAAVKKGDKWGYINTKGEEVIPCQYAMASPFCEDKAAVQREAKGEWGYIDRKGKEVIPISIDAETAGNFSEGRAFILKDYSDGHYSIIDEQGKEICNGTGYYFGKYNPKQEHLPRYYRSKICFYLSTGDEVFYDKEGSKIHVENDQAYFSDTLKTYSVFYNESETGALMGLKDATGKEVIPAKYDFIHENARGENYISNGVALVELDEVSVSRNPSLDLVDGEDYSIIREGGYELFTSKRHYGYADLNGKDTFSDDIRHSCLKSKQEGKNELDRLQKEGPDWLQGAWRRDLTDEYGDYMFEVFNHGKSRCYAYGGLLYEHEYTYKDESSDILAALPYIQYANGEYYQLDNNRQVVIDANGNDMEKVSDDVNYVPTNVIDI